jgi:hypothetical protein
MEDDAAGGALAAVPAKPTALQGWRELQDRLLLTSSVARSLCGALHLAAPADSAQAGVWRALQAQLQQPLAAHAALLALVQQIKNATGGVTDDAALQQALAALATWQAPAAVAASIARALSGEAPAAADAAPQTLLDAYRRIAKLTLREARPGEAFAAAMNAWTSGGRKGARPRSSDYE